MLAAGRDARVPGEVKRFRTRRSRLAGFFYRRLTSDGEKIQIFLKTKDSTVHHTRIPAVPYGSFDFFARPRVFLAARRASASAIRDARARIARKSRTREDRHLPHGLSRLVERTRVFARRVVDANAVQHPRRQGGDL